VAHFARSFQPRINPSSYLSAICFLHFASATRQPKCSAHLLDKSHSPSRTGLEISSQTTSEPGVSSRTTPYQSEKRSVQSTSMTLTTHSSPRHFPTRSCGMDPLWATFNHRHGLLTADGGMIHGSLRRRGMD